MPQAVSCRNMLKLTLLRIFAAGAYYIEYAKTSTKKYQLFFEGGGWCYNDKDCANRATGDLGSSKNYPSQIDMAGGVASANCNINPAFCDFNKVYMKVSFCCVCV